MFTDPNFMLQLMRGGFGGGGAYANQNRGMPSFATNRYHMSPLENQNRRMLGYAGNQSFANTPSPMNYTGLFAMSNPFWGQSRIPQPLSPGVQYGRTDPGAAWRNAMMGSLPGVMQDMDINRTLTDWWPGAGPTFTRMQR